MSAKKIIYHSLLGIFLVVFFFLSSCKKDKIDRSGQVELKFSTDTLTFDTLFVSLGSTTRSFTVRNPSKKQVEISHIYLKGMNNSNFRLTIDGDLTNEVKDIIIPAQDSIYIFAEVTVDPNREHLPFIIEDEVVFETKGKKQQVILNAYGQNAHFINGETIETQTWTNDLPYVILNSVEIAEHHTLTIQEGVTVYFGGNSGMFVSGTLKVEGGKDTTGWVTFRGYRLDKQVTGVAYDKLPGQWLGVFLMRGSQNNEINNFRMRGSQYGLNIGNTEIAEIPNISFANAPDLKISNSIIYNSSTYGIFAFLSKVDATNVLIYNAGKNAFNVSLGGEYDIKHCTFYLKPSVFLEHKEPAVYISNYHIIDVNSPTFTADLNFKMTNSIADGSGEDEILYDLDKNTTVKSMVENSAIRNKITFPDVVETNVNLYNENFGYIDVNKDDYRLGKGSVLINKGKNIGIKNDILWNPRDEQPDIGAFEYIE
ncbi:MAG: hypothetical protein M9887_00370 [Chitinophagales bacterium]|nr:hypothetical protein [Chitinophagales bacterium]